MFDLTCCCAYTYFKDLNVNILLDAKSFIYQMSPNYSFPKDYLDDLQSQFQIDPLLMRFVVKKTSIANLPLLVGKVPLFLLLLRLAQECDSYKQVGVTSLYVPLQHCILFQILLLFA